MNHVDRALGKAQAGLRRTWLTVMAVAVWPLAVLLFLLHAEDREYWGRVLALSLVLAGGVLAVVLLSRGLPGG